MNLMITMTSKTRSTIYTLHSKHKINCSIRSFHVTVLFCSDKISFSHTVKSQAPTLKHKSLIDFTLTGDRNFLKNILSPHLILLPY